mmetsp:Transcript_23872/g.46426  ORF Transcript_23872/g.46426 Transcript_23872/m.46426 type:complete len:532 (+) Transcript_23872:64-1659(+)
MTVERATTLERFQSLVSWAAGAQEMCKTEDISVASAKADEDWYDSEFAEVESRLQHQNLANDTLCTENGRLRAEIDRLQVEEKAAVVRSGQTDDEHESQIEAAKSQLLGSIVSAIQEAVGLHARASRALEHVGLSKGASSSGNSSSSSSASGEEVRENGAIGDAEVQLQGMLEEVDGQGEGQDSGRSTISAQEAMVSAQSPCIAGNLVPAIEAALRSAIGEETCKPLVTSVEETDALLAETQRLRELVETQQERIEELEMELSEAGYASAGAGAFSEAFTMTTARVLSDAGGKLSAGLSAVLAPRPTEGFAVALDVEKPPAFTIGAEYEVISSRGAIVRRGDSLRSDIVANIPAGSRVRVMAFSERYPRRAEIIFFPRPVPADAQACDEEVQQQEQQQDPPPDGDAVAETPAQAAPAAAPDPVVGWLSASAKDGRMLIRPAAVEAPDVSPIAAPRSPSSATATPQSRQQQQQQQQQQRRRTRQQRVLRRMLRQMLLPQTPLISVLTSRAESETVYCLQLPDESLLLYHCMN